MGALSKDIKLGTIEINVFDLRLEKDFYHKIMEMEVLKENSKSVTLGLNNNPLITLHHSPHLEKAEEDHAGLYHFAILFSSRGELSRMIHKIATKTPQHFQGTADHMVSEAFYFQDPEGNGIELYYDRDKSLWKKENGQIKMASIFIEPNEYLKKYIALEEKNTEVKMGHFHLKVGDIKKAYDFYVNVLGFDVTAELPGALFVSVCGYHHHFGLNSWHSQGAPARTESLGLHKLQIILQDKNEIEELKIRLEDGKIKFSESENCLITQDPWGNKIEFKSEN